MRGSCLKCWTEQDFEAVFRLREGNVFNWCLHGHHVGSAAPASFWPCLAVKWGKTQTKLLPVIFVLPSLSPPPSAARVLICESKDFGWFLIVLGENPKFLVRHMDLFPQHHSSWIFIRVFISWLFIGFSPCQVWGSWRYRLFLLLSLT